MSNLFNKYADYYDRFYQNKDYEAECDFIEAIFTRFSGSKVKGILDLGCGTGGHALPLSKRGYSVTGVEISENMLNQARVKASEIRARA